MGADEQDLTLIAEQASYGVQERPSGVARARKRIVAEDVEAVYDTVADEATTERVTVEDAESDSGEVETLADGSLSIPLFAERLVVTKQLVVTERVIVRREQVQGEQTVRTTLRHEEFELEADGELEIVEE